MTQTELAAALQISPQSVSKWECGLTAPDIENLCRMACVLGVSVDTLLGDIRPNGKAMIGIDGGGSKTEFVLFLEDGTILDTKVLGPCNPNAIGLENSVMLLRQGIDDFLSIRSDVCGIFVGSSGFLTGGNGKKIQTMLKNVYPHIHIRCETDIMNVIAAGTDSDRSVAVICGTGSIVYAKEKEKLTKLTGWGFLLSSSGSGYDIGRDVLRAALADVEGIGEKTLLSGLVEIKLGAPVSECIQRVYQYDQSYVASFAPLVFDAYEKGDVLARKIVTENAESLANVINHAARNYDCAKKVILSGGLLTGSTLFAQLVQERLDRDLSVTVVRIPQVLGACRLCARMCGVDVDKLNDKLISQYNERG